MEKINLYNCKECGNTIVTEDVDKGVTPMMLLCSEYGGCSKGSMISMMYNVPNILVASHEWYRPDMKDVTELEKNYVKNNGLLIRKKKF